ncbi:MAG: hypothetical protein J7J02_04240 [Sulfurovum sp.]|nr:hypothetical protein [Sulfurovum sp.]
MDIKKKLFSYIKTTTGWQIEQEEIMVSFSLHLRSNYDLFAVNIAHISVMFAYAQDNSVDLRRHIKSYQNIKDRCNMPVVLIFDYLDSRQINSLIQKQIPFIIKEKYIYLPFALMQIATSSEKLELPTKKEHLSPDADLILIAYLEKLLDNQRQIKEIASVIDREHRATSVALKLLDTLGYLKIEKHGRSKVVRFHDRFEVYDRLHKEGTSPVKHSFFTSAPIFGNKAVKSGYTALQEYSSLMDTTIPTVAISAKAKNLIKDLKACEEDEAIYKVEVWNRDPHTFSKGGAVNPLYLIRQFKDVDDERTEYAIEVLEKRYKDSK